MTEKVITNNQVKENLDMRELIEELEITFKSYFDGETEMPPKSYITVPENNGDFRSMPARVKTENINLAGVKWVNVHPDNKELPTVMASLVINNPKTGEPISFLEGDELTRYRTGAVSGLATKFLTPEGVKRLGIVGCGRQSYTQVKAVSEVRDIEEIYVSDISSKNIKKFRNKFGSQFDVYSVDNEEVMVESEVLCTLTPSRDPIISESKKEFEHHHINAIGADAEGKQELSTNITSNRRLVVDDVEQASHSGEVNVPISEGSVSKNDLVSLGEVLSNNIDLKEEKSIFDSTGLAIQDLTAAALVNRKL